MTFINKIKYLGTKLMEKEKYSLYLNELLRASCPSPFGPAELFKFFPEEFVRKNLAAPGKQLLRCLKAPTFGALGLCSRLDSTTCIHASVPSERRIATIPVGDLDRSPLMRSYGYASAGDRPTSFAIFPLIFVPFVQYAG